MAMFRSNLSSFMKTKKKGSFKNSMDRFDDYSASMKGGEVKSKSSKRYNVRKKYPSKNFYA